MGVFDKTLWSNEFDPTNSVVFGVGANLFAQKFAATFGDSHLTNRFRFLEHRANAIIAGTDLTNGGLVVILFSKQ